MAKKQSKEKKAADKVKNEILLMALPQEPFRTCPASSAAYGSRRTEPVVGARLGQSPFTDPQAGPRRSRRESRCSRLLP